MPASSPQRLAELVSSDISAALAEDPALDLQQYVRERYDNVFQTFAVIMLDGRNVSNDDAVPQPMWDALRADAQRRSQFQLRRFPQRGFGPRAGFPRRGDALSGETFQRRRLFPGGSRDADAGGGRGRGRAGMFPAPRGYVAPVVVGDALVGEVAVLPGGPPSSRIVHELGPTMGIVGGGVLAVGVALIAFVVFGPVRRRLRHVQDATERLGQGDLRARAPEYGGDEVAALARSFNRMAEELAARADALQASDKARRQLLADVSHELNTPLTAMRGYLETLSMPDLATDAATRHKYLGIVMEESHRLERIIGDLLDLARLEGGGQPSRCRRSLSASGSGMGAKWRPAAFSSSRPSRLTRKRSQGIPIASNRRSRTLPRTRCAIPRTEALLPCRPGASAPTFASASPTAVEASRRSIFRRSSTDFIRLTCRGNRPAAVALVCRL